MSYVKTTFSSSTGLTDDVKKKVLDFIDWVNGELIKVEDYSKLPQVQGLSFEQLYAEPLKYREGDLYYFAAGVAGAPGLFIRDSNSWRKL